MDIQSEWVEGKENLCKSSTDHEARQMEVGEEGM